MIFLILLLLAWTFVLVVLIGRAIEIYRNERKDRVHDNHELKENKNE